MENATKSVQQMWEGLTMEDAAVYVIATALIVALVFVEDIDLFKKQPYRTIVCLILAAGIVFLSTDRPELSLMCGLLLVMVLVAGRG